VVEFGSFSFQVNPAVVVGLFGVVSLSSLLHEMNRKSIIDNAAIVLMKFFIVKCF